MDVMWNIYHHLKLSHIQASLCGGNGDTWSMKACVFENGLFHLAPDLLSLGNDWSVFTNWLCARKDLHQISLARDSGGLSTLFYWCVFPGFLCMISQLEKFLNYRDLLFFPPGVCNLFLPLVSVCSTAGSLELLQTSQLSFVLSRPQAPRVFWSLVRETETSLSGILWPQKLEH